MSLPNRAHSLMGCTSAALLLASAMMPAAAQSDLRVPLIKTAFKASALTVTGELPLLMTDYGITPPKAMLGMLKRIPRSSSRSK
jgi:hypothetical protein